MDSKQILSMNLKLYREKYNLSQEKFANKISSSLVYVNQIENCKRKLSLDMLDKITDGFNKIQMLILMTSSKLLEYDFNLKLIFLEQMKKMVINFYFLLIFKIIPILAILTNNDDPPQERNGSVTPVTGISPTTTIKFIVAWKIN